MLAGDLCFKTHRLDVLAQGVAVYLPERQFVVKGEPQNSEKSYAKLRKV